MTDLLLDKGDEFTRTEVATMDPWLKAKHARLDDIADRILRTGLRAEPYRSLLSEDPAKISTEQQETLRGLHRDFEDALAALREALVAKKQ